MARAVRCLRPGRPEGRSSRPGSRRVPEQDPTPAAPPAAAPWPPPRRWRRRLPPWPGYLPPGPPRARPPRAGHCCAAARGPWPPPAWPWSGTRPRSEAGARAGPRGCAGRRPRPAGSHAAPTCARALPSPLETAALCRHGKPLAAHRTAVSSLLAATSWLFAACRSSDRAPISWRRTTAEGEAAAGERVGSNTCLHGKPFRPLTLARVAGRTSR